jgi:hypothetical protein
LEHRSVDKPAGSHSPLKLVNPPVALMLHAAAPILLEAGVTLPGQHTGDPRRVVVETYPGFWARQVLGRVSYKTDDRSKQTSARRESRIQFLRALTTPGNGFGVQLHFEAAGTLQAAIDDGSGDTLDACVCAAQATWALAQGEPQYGVPEWVDPLEGWIASVPTTQTSTSRS